MLVAAKGNVRDMAIESLPRVGTMAVLAALVALAPGCSRYGTGEVTTRVSSDAESCVVTKKRISAGPVTFEIENKGQEAASYEVLGEGPDGKFTEEILRPHEVAAGGEGTMRAKLATGQFQVRCLLASGETPSVTIRTSVDGAAPPRVEVGSESIFRFTVTRDDAVDAPPPMRAKVGDVVTFVLDNRSDRPARLVVRGPDGGQTAAVSADARASSDTNATLSSAGSYAVQVGQNGARFSVEVSD